MRKDNVKTWIAATLPTIDSMCAQTVNVGATWVEIEALCVTGHEGRLPAYATAHVKGYALAKLRTRFPSWSPSNV